MKEELSILLKGCSDLAMLNIMQFFDLNLDEAKKYNLNAEQTIELLRQAIKLVITHLKKENRDD